MQRAVESEYMVLKYCGLEKQEKWREETAFHHLREKMQNGWGH